ncbi:MAG: DNA-binding protein [Candidatus Altiarchaeota archaeon]
MSELEELRQKRMRELALQQQLSQGFEQQVRAQEVEQQIKMIIQTLLTPEAQQRLANIRMARSEFARQIEILLIQLYQSGRLKKLTDDQLKALLVKISGTKRETKINVR